MRRSVVSSTIGLHVPHRVLCTPCTLCVRRALTSGHILDVPPYRSVAQSCQPHSSPADSQSKRTSYRSVFCATEGTSPAHSLRLLLLMAGIESNPGPIAERAAGKPCDACGGKIRKAPGKPEEDASHFKCADSQCGSVCHVKTDCSAIPRAQWFRTEWFCRSHNPSSSLSHNQSLPAQPPIPTPPASRCAKCGNGRMSNPVVCTQCNGAYHQARICSGHRNRYAVQAARSAWKCEQ